MDTSQNEIFRAVLGSSKNKRKKRIPSDHTSIYDSPKRDISDEKENLQKFYEQHSDDFEKQSSPYRLINETTESPGKRTKLFETYDPSRSRLESFKPDEAGDKLNSTRLPENLDVSVKDRIRNLRAEIYLITF